jgi:hypothetical protein
MCSYCASVLLGTFNKSTTRCLNSRAVNKIKTATEIEAVGGFHFAAPAKS